ncbi:MAG: electron transfer flavoprotein-ubiquinone oxidoreductase [Alphaproteobacteria bacterium]|nr:electron transfer flavoprotein-ubiquinone oxidoreductase [Alphaproteobacteria bacterium]
MTQRETMNYDVIIVGGGPAGLSAAIRLKQLSLLHNLSLSVCLLEKGSEIGAHILSGAVLEPRALNELIPDWAAKDAPLTTSVTHDQFAFLTHKKMVKLPTPQPMHNKGNYIISLSHFCRWLGQQAESLGVEIYPGFAAADILYNQDGQVIGVLSGDLGRHKDGTMGPNFQPGVELYAKQILFAEGCRGSLTQSLIKRFNLSDRKEPQTYGIGLKELWEIDPTHHKPGHVLHTIGWPLDYGTYGGSFLYHFDKNLISLGFVIGLDYTNPYLDPFGELQRFKTHPAIKSLLQGGKRLSYGARALNEGGFQSIPHLTFPGGALIGCGAGFLNVPKIKGTHTAMKSGMVAAEAIIDHMQYSSLHEGMELKKYPAMLRKSWVWKELKKVRNIRPAFHLGLWGGLIYSALDTYLFRGYAPWTFKHHHDHETLIPANQAVPIQYDKPDNVITFDRMSSVFLSNTNHEENQPCHLVLKDPTVAIDVNWHIYKSPEQRYCPAGVYEIIKDAGSLEPQLIINSQNCVHCKTCDIKDPKQNITWTTPQGGDGPNYSLM